VVLHERGGAVDVHPPHDLTVRAGDTLVIFARHAQITDIVARKRRRA
jgi:Trk K+ transport system NAD-binding subunit